MGWVVFCCNITIFRSFSGHSPPSAPFFGVQGPSPSLRRVPRKTRPICHQNGGGDCEGNPRWFQKRSSQMGFPLYNLGWNIWYDIRGQVGFFWYLAKISWDPHMVGWNIIIWPDGFFSTKTTVFFGGSDVRSPRDDVFWTDPKRGAF